MQLEKKRKSCDINRLHGTTVTLEPRAMDVGDTFIERRLSGETASASRRQPISLVSETADGLQVHAWTAAALGGLQKDQLSNLKAAVDKFGACSAKAQGLRGPVTDFGRLCSSDHILYLLLDATPVRGLVLGGIKIGRKNLFIRDHEGTYLNIKPLCVLDFYVHESFQRQGIGLRLFEEVLKYQSTTAGALAYDRPSNKLLNFLSKHYGLCSYLPQSNNFIIFQQYWLPAGPGAAKMNLKQQAELTRAGRHSPPCLPHLPHLQGKLRQMHLPHVPAQVMQLICIVT
ncbi:hypothetical protein WJX74_001612 [Apatococcus lobatus]|uniref:Alpha-tubulin N-acetyltransferase n=1 Tax=Apatococcus lobatus TaxID=904363 RepID=A0AAW1R9Z7_9CHLO